MSPDQTETTQENNLDTIAEHVDAVVEGVADTYGDDGLDLLVMLAYRHMAARHGGAALGAAHLLSLLPSALIAEEAAETGGVN